ncbi:unnamed protein product [Phaedon cochleariae]|uniref:C2H2-type domain-containing protein n=1 Tax=Phaedon cochleariae TaxID=80249 RepID=A0A9N9SAR7_PHACE|nr:unnamed protein product [Phaedon cochleariae]
MDSADSAAGNSQDDKKKAIKKFIKCNICLSLKEHHGLHEGECEICQSSAGRTFPTNTSPRTLTKNSSNVIFARRNSHYQNNFSHKVNFIAHQHVDTDLNFYECAICRKTFTSNHRLIQHASIHTGEEPLECDISQKKFSRKNHLIFTFECDTCQKQFTSADYLREHSKLHDNLKSFEHLITYMRKHIVERPFKCDMCQKAFKRKFDMTRHRRIHTGEKPFECHICQRKFASKKNLLFHIDTHTAGKSFECDICEKSFSRKILIIEHCRLHTGEAPYECSMCQQIFAFKSHLLTHVALHAGGKPFQRDVKKSKLGSQLNSHSKARHSEIRVEGKIVAANDDTSGLCSETKMKSCSINDVDDEIETEVKVEVVEDSILPTDSEFVDKCVKSEIEIVHHELQLQLDNSRFVKIENEQNSSNKYE